MRTLWSILLAVALLASLARPSRASPGADPEPRAGLWLSITGFVALATPAPQAGFLAALGVPFDEIVSRRAAPPLAAIGDPPATLPPPPSPRGPTLFVTPEIARQAVAAAWRTAGVGDADRLSRLATRARLSALLPEVRLRVMRTTQDGAPAGDDTTSSSYYSPYAGNKTWLEGRATFRLDRLVFADEEVPIERLRADLLAEKQRIAHHALEELGKWQRASVDLALAPVDSADRVDAELRMIEAAGALDVMTGGWFSSLLASRNAEDKPPS